VVLAKFSSCALAVGSGIPAGPEGPMIHMGSILGSLVSQGQLFIGPHLEPLKAKIAHFKNIGDRRDFMAAGVAGGVAAAFGAPIGGLLFVAEEVVRLIIIIITIIIMMMTLSILQTTSIF
jgi:chloride channel 7